MRVSSLALALWLCAPGAARAQEADPPGSEAKPSPYRPFVSALGSFSLELPAQGWPALEEETAWGAVSHFFGPAEEGGRWRAGLNVTYLDKTQAGFVPMDEAVRRERASDDAAARSASEVRRSRVARRSARCFEVTETRVLPPDRLPAAPSVLHRFFAFVPSGDGYFILQLSTSRETYLDRRAFFEHVLETFRILGAG